MARIILGAIAGFVVWLVIWFGAEKLLSTVWPAFGVHQQAYWTAFRSGGAFKASPTILFVQIVVGAVLTLLTGRLAAKVSADKLYAPAILATLLMATFGMNAVLTLGVLPFWYHLLFIGMFFPLAIRGAGHRAPPPRRRHPTNFFSGSKSIYDELTRMNADFFDPAVEKRFAFDPRPTVAAVPTRTAAPHPFPT